MPSGSDGDEEEAIEEVEVTTTFPFVESPEVFVSSSSSLRADGAASSEEEEEEEEEAECIESTAVFGGRRAGLIGSGHSRRKLVFYADTACAVIAHLRKHDPAAINALGALGPGQLHEHAHTCQQDNSMIYRELAGLGHGEEAETVWAKLKGVWPSLSKPSKS
jgi:hypothetical protein